MGLCELYQDVFMILRDRCVGNVSWANSMRTAKVQSGVLPTDPTGLGMHATTKAESAT